MNIAQFLRKPISYRTCKWFLQHHMYKSIKIMRGLHKLILSRNWWKETVFIFIFFFYFKGKESKLICIIWRNLLVFSGKGKLWPPSVCLWHAMKNVVYAWIVHRYIVNHWTMYCEIAQPLHLCEGNHNNCSSRSSMA